MPQGGEKVHRMTVSFTLTVQFPRPPANRAQHRLTHARHQLPPLCLSRTIYRDKCRSPRKILPFQPSQPCSTEMLHPAPLEGEGGLGALNGNRSVSIHLESSLSKPLSGGACPPGKQCLQSRPGAPQAEGGWARVKVSPRLCEKARQGRQSTQKVMRPLNVPTQHLRFFFLDKEKTEVGSFSEMYPSVPNVCGELDLGM